MAGAKMDVNATFEKMLEAFPYTKDTTAAQFGASLKAFTDRDTGMSVRALAECARRAMDLFDVEGDIPAEGTASRRSKLITFIAEAATSNKMDDLPNLSDFIQNKIGKKRKQPQPEMPINGDGGSLDEPDGFEDRSLEDQAAWYRMMDEKETLLSNRVKRQKDAARQKADEPGAPAGKARLNYSGFLFDRASGDFPSSLSGLVPSTMQQLRLDTAPGAKERFEKAITEIRKLNDTEAHGAMAAYVQLQIGTVLTLAGQDGDEVDTDRLVCILKWQELVHHLQFDFQLTPGETALIMDKLSQVSGSWGACSDLFQAFEKSSTLKVTAQQMRSDRMVAIQRQVPVYANTTTTGGTGTGGTGAAKATPAKYNNDARSTSILTLFGQLPAGHTQCRSFNLQQSSKQGGKCFAANSPAGCQKDHACILCKLTDHGANFGAKAGSVSFVCPNYTNAAARP